MYSKKINQLATNLNPQQDDLILIGDAVTGQLKTTTYSGVTGITSDGIISGGIVTWTGTGLNFTISACNYILNGIRYSSPFTTKTLDAADATFARIDVFAVNTSSEVVVIKGTPAANPVEPEGDTATTLGLTNVTINAGATTPNGVTRNLIYDENASFPTEWNKSNNVTGTIDYNSTTFSYTGTKSIRVVMNAGFAYLTFSKAVSFDISSFKSFSFAIRLNTAWTSNQILTIRFADSNAKVIASIQLNNTNNGLLGFNRNLGAVWQFITIPLDGSVLKFSQNSFENVQLYVSNAATTFNLDTISLNGGIKNPTDTTTSNSFGFAKSDSGTATSDQATDTLNVVGSGIITTSATGKTLTIASNQIATSSILGRVTASTGNIETLTGTQATTLLDVFTSSLKGLAPASGGGTTNFLRADGTWAAPSGGGGSMAIGGSITSATAGSVLFAGTSGVLQQDNTNFFWNDSNNRLGIGTNSPSYTLDVSGTARISNDVLVSRNFSGTTSLTISNTSSSAIATSNVSATSDAGTMQLGKLSTACIVIPIGLGDGYIANTSNHLVIQNAAASKDIKFASGGVTTAQMTLTAAGRLLIGTTTESTFILDVNGTTRLNGNITTNLTLGSVPFITTSSVIAQDNANFFWDNTNKRLGIGSASPTSKLFVSQNQNGNTAITLQNTTSGTSSQVGYVLNSDGSGTATFGKYTSTTTAFKSILSSDTFIYNANSGDITILNDFATGKIKFGAGGSSTAQATLTAAGRLLIGTTTEDTSALLNVTSTTQGFLPPRMTTTQKNAIGTPAAGLIVYDTTLNKLCVRTASAWETITSI
jgi:hypothetical protein